MNILKYLPFFIAKRFQPKIKRGDVLYSYKGEFTTLPRGIPLGVAMSGDSEDPQIALNGNIVDAIAAPLKRPKMTHDDINSIFEVEEL